MNCTVCPSPSVCINACHSVLLIYNRYNMGVAWQGVNAHPRFSLHGRNQASVLSLLCRTYHPYHVLTWIMFPAQRRHSVLAEIHSARLTWPPSHSTRLVYMCLYYGMENMGLIERGASVLSVDPWAILHGTSRCRLLIRCRTILTAVCFGRSWFMLCICYIVDHNRNSLSFLDDMRNKRLRLVIFKLFPGACFFF